MFSESDIDAVTVQAYLETDYIVHAADTFAFKVGSSNTELAGLYAAHGSDCSAFITAFNPFSKQLDAGENSQRQSSLEAELTRRGLKYFPGIGQHPSNLWPGEPSFLVLGITLESAKTLGARFEQNAIVWSGSDAVPQLVLLR